MKITTNCPVDNCFLRSVFLRVRYIPMKIASYIFILFANYSYASCDIKIARDMGTVPDGHIDIQIREIQSGIYVDISVPNTIELDNGRIISPSILLLDSGRGARYHLEAKNETSSVKKATFTVIDLKELYGLEVKIGDSSLPIDSPCFVRSKMVPIEYNQALKAQPSAAGTPQSGAP